MVVARRRVAAGQAPQIVVEAGVWQSARPLGRFALVGATVTPAFTFDGFELRARGLIEWARGRGRSAHVLLGRVGTRRAQGGQMSETQEQGFRPC